MTNVNGVAIGIDCREHCDMNVTEPYEVYICGDYLLEEADDVISGEYQAAIALIASDGYIHEYMAIAGTNFDSNKENQDKCMGIHYHVETSSLAVLIQGKMKELRQLTSGDYYDTILVLITSDGVARSTSIT